MTISRPIACPFSRADRRSPAAGGDILLRRHAAAAGQRERTSALERHPRRQLRIAQRRGRRGERRECVAG